MVLAMDWSEYLCAEFTPRIVNNCLQTGPGGRLGRCLDRVPSPRRPWNHWNMQLLLLVLGALLVMLGLSAFARATPAQLARFGRIVAMGGIVGLALLLLARGQLQIALIVLGAGLPLLLGRRGGLLGRAKSAGQASGVETEYLRVRLDHDSGAMEGEVLAGSFAGRSLSSLSRSEVERLLVECREANPRSVSLVEGYLDRRFPHWRDEPGPAGSSGGQGNQVLGAAMTPQEARRILDVSEAAGEEEIRSAWRELMKRNHPDQGGSSYLAAKINEAKDVLLGKS